MKPKSEEDRQKEEGFSSASFRCAQKQVMGGRGLACDVE